MPNIEVPEGASPGDVFRLIADWYDRTGEPMPGTINVHHHRHNPGGAEYVDVLAERYGVPARRMIAGGDTVSAMVEIMGGQPFDTGVPTVTVHAYRSIRDGE